MTPPKTESDAELLRLAAKAAGLTVWRGQWPQENMLFTRVVSTDGVVTGVEWNPLSSDADAFRLAVKLGIGTGIDMQNMFITAYQQPPRDGHFTEDAHDCDPYAATRRAITRAAAAIGREMK